MRKKIPSSANSALKPVQNKKGQKNLGYPTKKAVFFPYKRTAFLSGTPNFFGPSCFEAALVGCLQKITQIIIH